jgi:hypothetical protein
LLFETHDRDTGWNGFFNNRLLEEGIYIYRIEGVFATGEEFLRVGDVLLMR